MLLKNLRTKGFQLKLGAVFLFVCMMVLGFSIKAGATGYNVTGNVTTKVGTIVNNFNNVSVYATNPSSSTVLFGPVTTNSSGNYTLVITTPGTYDIHFQPPFNTGYSPIVDSSVSVTTSIVQNAQFNPLDNHTLSGTLTDNASNPLPGVTVELLKSGAAYSTTTDSSGNYSVTAPAGYYYLYLNGSMTGMYGFTLTQSNTSSINLINTDMTLNLVIHTATISITAYNDAGQPYLHDGSSSIYVRATSGVTSLYPGDPGTSINVAFSNGFSGSPTGTIKTIVGATYTASGLDSSSSSTSMCEKTPVNTWDCLVLPYTVAGDASVAIPQTSPATRTFSGTLTDSTSSPIAGAQVTLQSGDDTSTTATTDSSGNFSISAEPKKYSLTVSGTNVDNMDSFTLSQSTSNRTIDLTAGNVSQNLQVNTANITATADDRSGSPNYATAVYAKATSGTAYLYSGDPGESIVATSTHFATSPGNATGTLGTIVGAQYSAFGLGASNWVGSICEVYNSNPIDCITSALTVSGSTSVNVPY